VGVAVLRVDGSEMNQVGLSDLFIVIRELSERGENELRVGA
jgi:hypothetical protein